MGPPLGLLVDLSGVLYVGDEPVAGAAEAVGSLREAGVSLAFVTNTTASPRRAVARKLERMGMEVGEGELLTPAGLALERCRAAGHERVALMVAEELREDLPGLGDAGDRPDAVILGDLGDGFTPDVLNRAFRMVSAGAELIALQRNRAWESEEGLVLDLGPYVAALEYAAGIEATVVGKPSPAFFRLALDRVGTPAGETAMVGDDVEADVGGAQEAGLTGILVRTGKYRADAVERSGVEPDHVVDSFAEVPALLGVG